MAAPHLGASGLQSFLSCGVTEERGLLLRRSLDVVGLGCRFLLCFQGARRGQSVLGPPWGAVPSGHWFGRVGQER